MVQIALAHAHWSRGPFYNISDHSDILRQMHDGKVVPDYGSPCALFLDNNLVSRPSRFTVRIPRDLFDWVVLLYSRPSYRSHSFRQFVSRLSCRIGDQVP